MLVALLVANLVDAPGISWINYTTLIYDIFSAAIARFAGLTKRSQKDSANRQLFSTFKNGIPEYHVEEAIKVVIMYINDRHKPAFYPED